MEDPLSKFDEIFVGQIATIIHTITAEDIGKFVQLTGDDNRLHVDPVYAANTSFKKPVAHGMLGASFISTIIGTKLPGDGALWYEQSLEFLLPVHIGDTLTITAEVLKKDERSRTIELQTDISNQHRQKVTKGRAKVRVIDQLKPKVQDSTECRPIKKVALVVGGSGGIGSATCIALAEAGFDVALTYNTNSKSADSLAEIIESKGVRSGIYKCNVTNELAIIDMVENVVRRFGAITAVINCTTSSIASINFKDLVWDDFSKHLDNQISGSFSLIKAVAPIMESQKYGKVVFVGTQAIETPSASWLPYITAKGALSSFAKALAIDVAKYGIRVNIVSPGMTDTDQLADIPERVLLTTAAKTPLKRLATPQDVANAIVFLASDKSDYLTGETIRVNGGQVMI